MKKSCILAAVFFSFFVFCTKDNSTSPTEVTAKSEYTDSMVINLYSYFMWCLQHNNSYYGTVIITPKGQNLVQTPLDSNLKAYNSGPFTYPIFAPKYPPSKFEAFVYDSVPLIETDSLDTQLLVKSYSSSRYYFYRLDSASTADSVQNIEKGIHQIDVSYLYGFGFYFPIDMKFGLGKIKIYYK